MIPKHNPTRPAQQVWRFLFGTRWPRGWLVRWRRSILGAFAHCYHETRVIEMDWREANWPRGHPVADLLHEFVHIVYPTMEHGEAFEEIAAAYCAKLGIANSHEKRGANGKRKGSAAGTDTPSVDDSRTPEGLGEQNGVGKNAG